MSAAWPFPFARTCLEINAVEGPGTRQLATGLLRTLILCSLFSLMLLPEYVQGTADPSTKSLLYSVIFGGLRLVDLTLLAAVALHAIALAASRAQLLRFPRGPAYALLVLTFITILGLVRGALNGGTNLFFDWRAAALGAGLYIVYSFWIRTPAHARHAVNLFVLYMGVRIMVLLCSYFAGSGEVLLGVRTPLFDGPSLSAFGCAGLIALGRACVTESRWRKALYLLMSASAYVIVLLAFRRTYWAELLLASSVLVLLWKHLRTTAVVLLVTASMIAVLWVGPAMLERVLSVNVLAEDMAYGEDNADHVGDLEDAWEQIRESPLLGIGLGHSYPTWNIRDWKDESVMVHNAALHVWLKYGLGALLAYLAYHLLLFRSLKRLSDQLYSHNAVLVKAALAYLAAQFIVSLGFTPWPYSSLQSTNLIAFVLAIANAHANTYALGNYTFVQ